MSASALALAAATMLCDPASAQDDASAIEARIESVFTIVPGNPLDLAVPLTRRALARRMTENAAPPLPYVDAGSAEAVAPLPRPRPVQVSAVDPGSALSGEVEEGSAEGDADEEFARLPRARPNSTDSAADAGRALPNGIEPPRAEGGTPLDLVAGAAIPTPPAVPPPAEPQQLLPAPQASILAASDAGAPAIPPMQDMVAGQSCLPLSDLADKDGDFARNAAPLSASGFCLAQQKFRERRRSWTVQTVSSGRPGPLWAVMHDDEDVAFDAGVRALGAYGGTLVTIETGGRRNLDGIDPNRNFSDAEISCKKLGKAATPDFTAAFRALMDPAQPVIALHNNDDDSRRGLGHVSMDSVPKDMRKLPSSDPEGPLAGERALVLMAAVEPVGATVEARMRRLSEQGINVVLEPVRKGRGDCSLSNYAVLSGYQNYLNVTVDSDEGEKLAKIIDAVLAVPAVTAAR